ncbi:MAG TPA: SprT-like domain-containing protein [Thermodesulfovibrionia bacterium]|nr:SprT-like domain-containing protein [Thermodesulfovibrionia bacterium]
MDQIPLPLNHSEETLQIFFNKSFKQSVRLTLTENAVRLISARPDRDGISIRLHRIFQHAGHEVLTEIVEFIRTKKLKTPLIRDFIRKHSGSIKKAKVILLRTQGRYYNLTAIYDSLNHEYFNNRLTSSVTWGRLSNKRVVRRIILGSYNAHANLIRINPILDRITVPQYFVEFIVYHEMLHAELGISETDTRRIIHSKEFKTKERLFRHYHKAIAWEKEYFHSTMNCRPVGR